MDNLIYEKDGAFFIRGEHQESGSDEGRSELTQWQYEQIRQLSAPRTEGSLSEADILRLHQEQDPASPLFKGSEPTDRGNTGTASGASESSPSYNEPTRDQLAEAAKNVSGGEGTSIHSTEEVAGITEEPGGDPEPLEEGNTGSEEIPHVVTEETLEDNPELVDEGVEVGETITYPSEEPSAEETAEPENQVSPDEPAQPTKPTGRGNARNAKP